MLKKMHPFIKLSCQGHFIGLFAGQSWIFAMPLPGTSKKKNFVFSNLLIVKPCVFLKHGVFYSPKYSKNVLRYEKPKSPIQNLVCAASMLELESQHVVNKCYLEVFCGLSCMRDFTPRALAVSFFIFVLAFQWLWSWKNFNTQSPAKILQNLSRRCTRYIIWKLQQWS